MNEQEKIPDQARENRMLRLFLTGGLLFCFCTGLVFLYFHPPGSTRFLPPCLFYRLTGLYCAGCGSTRALYTALHGDFAGALRCNLLLFPLLLLIALFLWRPRLLQHTRLLLWIVFFIVLYWVLRNLPFHPFLLLAPH